MKKTIYFLCFFQYAIVGAQTETFVSPNGKKVLFNPVFINTADNGLTKTGNNIELGGALKKVSILTTTATNTLSITGLETDNTTNNIMAVDANGVLKTVTKLALTGTEPWYNIADNNAATLNTQNIYQMGNVGIGQNAAATKLDVKSATAGAVTIQDGTEQDGFVLESDANGVGTWQVNDLSITVVEGVITTTRIDLSNNYAQSYITLPEGNWAVYLGILANPVISRGTTTPPNTSCLARFTLGSSTTSNSGVTFIDSNKIIYNSTVTGSNPGRYPLFATGCMRVVSPAGGKTFYLWSSGSTNISIAGNMVNYFYAMKTQ